MEIILIGGLLVLLLVAANKQTPAPTPVASTQAAPVQVWPTYQAAPALPGIPPQTVSQDLGAPVLANTLPATIQQQPNSAPIPSGIMQYGNPADGTSGGLMTQAPNPAVQPGRIMPPPGPPVVDTPTLQPMLGRPIIPVNDTETAPPLVPLALGSIPPPIAPSSPTLIMTGVRPGDGSRYGVYQDAAGNTYTASL